MKSKHSIGNGLRDQLVKSKHSIGNGRVKVAIQFEPTTNNIKLQ